MSAWVLFLAAASSEEDVNHLIRFHFAKRDDTLKAALNRLSELELKAKTYKQ